ncbi:11806_t:CDS:2 [Entrophospora sp. SA101]|nr:11806_t:CDS:2 [Entrophospora sp. SA101]CAJ0863472.1 15843_t:CDS:2 [Entrophospora sp. SA101]
MKTYPNPHIGDLSDTFVRSIIFLRSARRVTLESNNGFFESTKFQTVEQRRLASDSIVIESISHCDNLVGLGKELMEFFESCNNESISNEDILDDLNLLLNDAKRLKTTIEGTNSKIKSLNEGMTTVYDKGTEFGVKDMTNLKYDDDLKNAESREKVLKVMKGLTTTMVASRSVESAFIKNKKVPDGLSGKQIHYMSESIQDSVFSIISVLKNLEFFWNKNADKLERLIEKFEVSSERKSRPNKLILRRLERQWKETVEECKNITQRLELE